MTPRGGGGTIDRHIARHGRGAFRGEEEALRKELEFSLDWTRQDRDLLEKHRGLLSRRTGAFAERLYEYLFSNPSIAERLYRIRDEGGDMGEFVRHLLRLLLTLFSPTLDWNTLAKSARLLEERDFQLSWLLGIYRLFFDFLLDELDRADELDAPTRRAIRSALGKHLCFDLGLLIELLAHEAEQAGRRDASGGGARDAIRRAIARNEFVLHYQPQVATASGEPVGFEALVRWQHPERGLLLPAQFLHEVEAAGMMAELTRWVIETALCQAGRWHRQWGRTIPVAVNVPAEVLAEPGFVDWLVDVFDRSAGGRGLIELELAASGLEQLATCRESLLRLADSGVHIVIEDFGTSRHALASLDRLPIARVKLDRVLLEARGTAAEGHSLAHALVTLGHEMGYRVLAEGVETERERRLAVAAGCDALQGHHVLSPAPAEAIGQWLGRLM